MRVLAIETSCDETGIAILEGVKTDSGFSFSLLGASALNSQATLHAEFGGVYPSLAKREHEKNLPIILEQALQNVPDLFVDAIAVTQGPGLEPALWTGIIFAQKLAKEKNVPLLLTNHMEGHFISSLTQNNTLQNVQLPVLALLISGGHTEFDLMEEWFEYKIIGQTLDDAVGEAYDKVARMLGLPYPGGPEISKLAESKRRKEKVETDFSLRLPRPMINTKDYNMSFSGLKTAVLYKLRDRGTDTELSQDEKELFAEAFEDAVADVFITKTRRALENTSAKSFVIGGGVAANQYLRQKLQELIDTEFPEVTFYIPELSITGDNAIMIAEAALVRALSGLDDTPKNEVRAYSNRFSINKPQ